MAVQIQVRRGTTAEWSAANPVLAEGEIGLDTTLDNIKIGDGVTAWTSLNFFALSESSLSNHESDTTNVHGIADTSLLATTSYVDTAESDAVTTANAYSDSLATNYDPAGSAATSESNANTYTDSAVSTHNLSTTSVHGISNTANLVYTDDSRLSDSRTPTAHAATHASGGTDEITVAQSQVTNLATDLSSKIPSTEKGAANGVATLDGNTKIPSTQLPAITITSTFVVVSESAMLAITAQEGDVAVRSDLNKSFILAGSDPTILANWQELLTPTDAVQSVDGRTGTVSLSDLYDASGSASTAESNANSYTDSAISTHNSDTTNVHGITDTSDLVVTSDLSAYAPLSSPALTGTPTAPTASAGTNSTQIATTAYADAAATSAAASAQPTIHPMFIIGGV